MSSAPSARCARLAIALCTWSCVLAVAGVVLLEARDDEPLSVPPLPRRLRVVPGADVGELPLRHGDHPVIGPLHRSADLRGLLGEPLRVRFAPLGLRFGRSGQERSPEHRDALGRAVRVVVERDDRPVGAAEPQPERPLLLRREEPAPLGPLRGPPRPRPACTATRRPPGNSPSAAGGRGPGRPGRCPRGTARRITSALALPASSGPPIGPDRPSARAPAPCQ